MSLHRSMQAASAAMVACALALFAVAAVAQTAPPIKPGLWAYEIGGDSPADDARRAKAMQKMASLPPEARAKIEAMMKQRGVSMNGGGLRICQTKQSLESGKWAADKRQDCKIDFSQRNASAWKWRTTCPDAQSDGVATFTSGNAYSVDMTTTVTKAGAPTRTMTTHVKANWISADCGDLKPIQH